MHGLHAIYMQCGAVRFGAVLCTYKVNVTYKVISITSKSKYKGKIMHAMHAINMQCGAVRLGAVRCTYTMYVTYKVLRIT